MDLSKIFLLTFLVSLSMCTRVQLSKAQVWNPVKTSPTYSPDLRQCFCYYQKTSGMPVLEKLSDNGENLQRLVVHLYKKPKTNEIKAFIPNYEKQKAIPDLSFDDGDHLEEPLDNLQTVFTKYPDLVTERTHIPPSGTYEESSRKLKGMKAPSKQQIIKVYDDDIFYDDQPPRKKNTRNPTHISADYDDDYTTNQNSNFDLDSQIQPYFDIESDTPDAPINVISVNINRKKANPIIHHRGNRVKVTKPNRGRFIPNLDSNNDPNDVVVEYPENSEIEETIVPPDSVDVADDGDGDDIDAPDPEEIIAEKDFKEMPPELTDEITDINQPTSNRKILNTLVPNQITKNPIIETHTVPTDFSNTYTTPRTDVPVDIDFTSNEIMPIDNEIQKPDSFESDTDMNNEIVPLIENESVPQLELPTGNNQWINIKDEKRRELDDILSNDMMNFNKPPHLTKGSNTKPIGKKQISPVPINVQKRLIDTLFPGHKIPLDYIKNARNRPLITDDLSYFTVHPDSLIKKYNDVNRISFQDTFDNWFDRQMKRVRFINSRASNSIDIYTLKYLIEKTLHEKGMFVTEKGYMIDSDGHILSTANLGLRPILIGNSVEYKNLLQGKYTTYNLPMDMPYLEAVLINSIDPPKILGIIPLGKTYLPKTIQKPWDGIIGNGCGGICNMQDMLLPTLNSRRNRGKTYLGPRTIRPRVNHRHPPGRHLLRRRPYTRRIFPFDQVNEFIDKIYRVPLRDSEVIQRPNTYVVNYETGPLIRAEPVVKYPIPIAVSEVTPGFRIIGGNPATSSGTPVSSRGRSGYDSSENALSSTENEN